VNSAISKLEAVWPGEETPAEAVRLVPAELVVAVLSFGSLKRLGKKAT
jgi:hypothetical protein